MQRSRPLDANCRGRGAVSRRSFGLLSPGLMRQRYVDTVPCKKEGLSREPGLKSSILELLLLCFPSLSFSAPLSACPTACPAALPSRVRSSLFLIQVLRFRWDRCHHIYRLVFHATVWATPVFLSACCFSAFLASASQQIRSN